MIDFSNTSAQPNIAFIGAGNMAKAVIAGLIRAGYEAKKITVTAPSLTNREKLHQQFGVLHTDNNSQAVKDANVIILAVKPQLMESVCEVFAGEINGSGKLVITLAAGIRTERYLSWFGHDCSLVRVMPNTPSLIGEGMSGVYASEHVNQQQKSFTQTLLTAIGKYVWLENEADINLVIAAAGSAPAYFFVFMQAMHEAAIKMGCSPEQAIELVRQAGIGAMALVKEQTELDFKTLAAQVTSKGGTTAEALNTFEHLQLNHTVESAMRAAVKRAEEMEKLF